MNHSEQQPIHLCAVCGAASNVHSFGVFACHACVAFFRRSRGQKYECRKGNDCDITKEGKRASCKACRLRACYDAGMSWANASVVHGSQGANDSRPASTASTSGIAPLQTTSEFDRADAAKPTNILLGKIMANFRRLRHAQKSIYAMDHPESIFTDQITTKAAA
ncbi:estrogen receptor beta-like protein [Aphelenchoides avenae]|nr:estrogen receptor beta-like protein [Aphelenchus avenae]